MRAISSSVQPECIIINQCSQYTINSSGFPVWSWWLYCTCLSVFLFIFSANFSATSVPIIMTWLVFEVLMVVLERGVGVGKRGGGGVKGGGFYSKTANPPIKRVLFNNAGQFPEVGLTPPLFYKEIIFHTQTSQIGCRGG